MRDQIKLKIMKCKTQILSPSFKAVFIVQRGLRALN